MQLKSVNVISNTWWNLTLPGQCSAYMVLGNMVKVLSVNCQGLKDLKKRFDVLNYLHGIKVIVFSVVFHQIYGGCNTL